MKELTARLRSLHKVLREVLPVVSSVIELVDRTAPALEDLPEIKPINSGNVTSSVQGVMFAKFRESVELTQAGMATCLGVSTMTVSRYERGLSQGGVMGLYANIITRIPAGWSAAASQAYLSAMKGMTETERMDYLYTTTHTVDPWGQLYKAEDK